VKEGSPLGHTEGAGVVTKPATFDEEGVRTFYCVRCGVALRTEAIPKLTDRLSDCEFLRERAASILKNGLKNENLRLVGKVLTLVIEDREFVLSVNASNRNLTGKIKLDDGCWLNFDIKGNGSNIKVFEITHK